MENQGENKRIKPPSWKEQNYFPARYLVSLMAFLGMTCNFMLTVNINFTIQAMVKPSNDSNGTDYDNDVCNFTDTDSEGSDYEGDFVWDEFVQGLVVGAFYWGYIWTQIPGGRLAEVFGAKIVMGSCLGTSALLALFIPIAAHSSYQALMAVRILQGLAEGAMYPVALVLVSTWAPPSERSMITTFVCAGDSFGTIIAFPMAAAIVNGIGWEAVFYIQACIALVWCVLWFLLISDDPKTFRFITDAERKYIASSIGEGKSKKSPPIPWRSIATSMPFWAMVVVGLGDSWGWYTLLTDLPLYMKEMLKMDMATNAMASGLPYLGAWIFGLTSSIIGDKLLQNGTIKTGLLRRIAQTLAHMGPGLCLFSLSFITCDKVSTITILFVAIAFQGVAYVGFIANAVDIAPNFAGTLYGMIGTISTIPGVLAPMTVGILTKGQQTFEQWSKVFYIAFGIYCCDVLFYWIFCSGEVQSWNNIASTEEDINIVEKQSKAKGMEQESPQRKVGHANLEFKGDTVEIFKNKREWRPSSVQVFGSSNPTSSVTTDGLHQEVTESKVEEIKQGSSPKETDTDQDGINIVQSKAEDIEQESSQKEIGHDNLNFKGDTEEVVLHQEEKESKVEGIKEESSTKEIDIDQDGLNIVEKQSKVEDTEQESSQKENGHDNLNFKGDTDEVGIQQEEKESMVEEIKEGLSPKESDTDEVGLQQEEKESKVEEIKEGLSPKESDTDEVGLHQEVKESKVEEIKEGSSPNESDTDEVLLHQEEKESKVEEIKEESLLKESESDEVGLHQEEKESKVEEIKEAVSPKESDTDEGVLDQEEKDSNVEEMKEALLPKEPDTDQDGHNIVEKQSKIEDTEQELSQEEIGHDNPQIKTTEEEK